MPLTDRAYWPGDDENPPEDRPRCKATPTRADVAVNRAMRRNTWECSLWAGHAKDPSPRYHEHAWVQTGEDD
jgi:hypothetical protein